MKSDIKRILIADDHPIIRKGLKQIIVEEMMDVQVDESADGLQAQQMALKDCYDIIILDISLPGKNGLDVLKQLIDSKIHGKVLILSIYSEDQYGIRAIRAGAAGFMNKDSAPNDLIDAINTILLGRNYVTPKIAEQMVNQLAHGNKQLHETLSDREFQVMLSLASGRTVNEIADELNLSSATINTYRARVLEKLNLRNHAELARYVMQEGLLQG